ncbi:MAG: pyridoxamine 5'-phosphate oxidase [Bdellovibrionota bacterium]
MKIQNDPLLVFTDWFAVANEKETIYPNAMTLATISKYGYPESRIVLLKTFNENGFVFFTNYDGQKAQELEEMPRASICFHWKTLEKQVRIMGNVEKVSHSESDAYFATRSRMSQIVAWASKQSQPMESEYELKLRVAKYALKFHLGTVPRPDNWGGYRLKPFKFEFWEERPSRLHRRVLYEFSNNSWNHKFIFP